MGSICSGLIWCLASVTTVISNKHEIWCDKLEGMALGGLTPEDSQREQQKLEVKPRVLDKKGESILSFSMILVIAMLWTLGKTFWINYEPIPVKLNLRP